MDRYSELKLLLKNWEGNFLKEHQRKPTKADIENASEETQNMYREFRTLRQKREANESKSLVQDEAADQDTENQGPDSWGSHLNRSSVTPKMSSSERATLNASAQYYGMKLKSNLGGAGKNRPLSLKKPSTPRSSSHAEKNLPPSPACDAFKPSPARVLPEQSSTLLDEDPSDPSEDLPLLGLRPPKISLTPSRHDGFGKKLHQLQSKVGQRLSSLNHDWLQRCELREAGASPGSKPVTGLVGSQERRTYSIDVQSPASRKDYHEIRQEVMSLDDTVEENQRVTIKRSDQPSQNLTKVDTRAEELEHQTRPALERKDVLPSQVEANSKQLDHKTHSAPENKKDALPSRVEANLEELRHQARPSPARKKGALSARVEANSEELGHHVHPATDHNKDKCIEAEEPTQDGTGGHMTSRGKRRRDATDDPDSDDAPLQKRRKSKVTTEKKATKKSTVEDSENHKVTPEKRRKRASKKSTVEDPENPKASPEKRHKRASKKSTVEEDPENPKVTPEKRRKRASKKSAIEEDPEDPPKTNVTGQVTENILGEVLEEQAALRATAPMPQYARAPQRKNDNFVRINLKKKSHVKNFVLNGNRLRKQMWKQKWQKKGEQFGGGGRPFNRGGDTCFHCGQMGHWASQCPGKVLPVPKPEEPEPAEEDIVLPSLEDVARMTNSQLGTEMEVCDDHPDVGPEVVRPIYEPASPPPAMKPLYELEPSGAIQETPPEVYAALAELGYRSFRPGQEEAVMRIMSGLSSLVILSTGMGKSLCYQLPAYLYAQRSPCITLVISPLVSLMDDQVSGLPSKLKAVCIHSNMTKNQREAAIDKVKQGKVHVLLLSPEALVGGGMSGSSCLPPADQLPPVAFACIDEVHCVSEWSHNFRPCYLRLCKVLRERLGVRCLLGLTATATLSTAQDVARHLEVSDSGKMPLRLAAVPPNLHLSVSMDQDRDQALVTLLKGDRFGCLDSVIIYCTRREETQRLAALLRTCLQGVTVKRPAEESEAVECDRKKIEARKKIRRPLKWMADSYHAGLSAAERRRVQNNFMSGQLRIVVATVAFGMGLDKSDVRGIIHYNMPKNFESYVQEIGRAGRDGKDAHCHLFLDPQSQDLDELRRHVYSDSVDYITVKKLVQRVLPKCKCRDIQKKREALRRGCEVNDEEMLDILEQCDGQEGMEDGPADVEDGPAPAQKTVRRVCHRHERALPIEQTVQALDVREEGIETLLCYLELHPSHWLELLHPTLSSCRVTCYSGPQQLRGLAFRCPPVAVALARERLAGIDHTHVSSVEFNVVEVADSMGWEVLPVKRALRDLQWNSSTNGGFRGTGRSGVLVEFSGLSFHFRSYGDLTNEELEEVCDFLHQKVSSREATALRQLKLCYRVFHRVAYRSSSACAERVNMERSNQLKAHILEYFEGKNPLEDETRDEEEEELRDKKVEDWAAHVSGDIRQFLSIHQDERFSGRAIARIFHGIGSPCYPAQVYGRDRRFWRKYLHLDFNKVMQICKEEVIRMR